jgi:hypothetical protein
MNNAANDRQWFRHNPDRHHRCRIASPAEIDTLRELGCFDNGETLAPNCFVHCLARIDRATGELQALLVVLEPGERDEAACREAWFQAELLTGHIERMTS